MRNKIISFLIGTVISVPIGILAIPHWSQDKPEQINYTDYYVESESIEEKVYGIDYGGTLAVYNDWVPDMSEMEMTYYIDRGTCADGVTEE